MKIFYECEICGFQSKNEKEVRECEAKGAEHKFSVGNKVNARIPGIGGGVTVKARVTRVFFKHQTHEPVYYLERIWRLPKGIERTLPSVRENKLSAI